MAAVEAKVETALGSMSSFIDDFLDEVTQGLSLGLPDGLPDGSSGSGVRVNVNVPISELRFGEVRATVPGVMEMAGAVTKLDETMKRPMRAVMDDQGNLIGTERVTEL
jgi:hypothetical protein